MINYYNARSNFSLSNFSYFCFRCVRTKDSSRPNQFLLPVMLAFSNKTDTNIGGISITAGFYGNTKFGVGFSGGVGYKLL